MDKLFYNKNDPGKDLLSSNASSWWVPRSRKGDKNKDYMFSPSRKASEHDSTYMFMDD